MVRIVHISNSTIVKSDNVRVIPDAGDVEIVGADKIAKLSAETSEGRPVAAWDQRIVIRRLFAISRSAQWPPVLAGPIYRNIPLLC